MTRARVAETMITLSILTRTEVSRDHYRLNVQIIQRPVDRAIT